MVFRRKNRNPNDLVLDSSAGDPQPPSFPPGLAGVTLSPAVEAEVRTLIGQRKKINAIKVIREHTRMGLKDAKDLVEAMEHGFEVRISASGTSGFGGGTLSARVRSFKDTGDHDAAVALVVAETGMSPAEAARFVAALD